MQPIDPFQATTDSRFLIYLRIQLAHLPSGLSYLIVVASESMTVTSLILK